MKPASPHLADLLARLGLAIGAVQVEIVDFHQAESGYVHHTLRPVALAGYALVSPAFARGRFPRYSFIDLIHGRPAMDQQEEAALAAVCGAEVAPPFWGNPEPFGQQLWTMIDTSVGDFFERVERRYGGGGDHFLRRPRGFDWANSEQAEIPRALLKWRRD